MFYSAEKSLPSAYHLSAGYVHDDGITRAMLMHPHVSYGGGSTSHWAIIDKKAWFTIKGLPRGVATGTIKDFDAERLWVYIYLDPYNDMTWRIVQKGYAKEKLGHIMALSIDDIGRYATTIRPHWAY